MKIYISKEDFVVFLHCSSVLEGRVSAAYKSLSGKVRDPLVKALLLSISYDSSKHSVIFMGLCKSFDDVNVGVFDCEGVMGRAWKSLISLSDEVSRQDKIGGEELVALVERMSRFESISGEEYLIRLDLQAIRSMIGDLDLDAEKIRSIFSGIIEDEKSHEKRMLMVKDIIVKQRSV